ncbi:hypothetical protein IKE99_01955 [Candidatus Saccharibacteria bacterium]|nr:hypothetical protein [Candidatus Saccharibacteria bacterium]
MDNLRLDPLTATLSADNTNAANAVISNYINGGNSDNISGWSVTPVTNASTDFNTFVIPQVNNTYKDTVTTNYGVGSGKIGTYYNYCAALVGTYCYGSNEGIDLSDTAIDITDDICPYGWRMPSGGPIGDYQALCTVAAGTSCSGATFISMNSASKTSMQHILSLPTSTFFLDSSRSTRNYSYWWSSTYGDNSGMYSFSIDNDNHIFPNFAHSRVHGFAIRCLAK